MFLCYRNIQYCNLNYTKTHMVNNQIKLLKALAKNIKEERVDRKKVVTSLQSAKILNKKENFTGTYGNLKRLISAK